MRHTTNLFDIDIEPLVDRDAHVSIDAVAEEQRKRESAERLFDSEASSQEVVDEWLESLGITYEDFEELRVGDKERARDAHRWELDPASAEDYVERRRFRLT